MAITILCDCGSTYHLKDELNGQEVQCPKCGKTHTAAKTVFDNDVFLVNQKHLSLSEKYFVFDNQKNKIMMVERSHHYVKNVLALFAAILVFGGVVFFSAVGGTAISRNTNVSGLIVLIGVLIGLVVASIVFIQILPFRHTIIYEGETKDKPLLTIQQDNKVQLWKATYTVFDNMNKVIARFKKPFVYDFFRKRWDLCDPNGVVLFIAREDSVVLSLLRRLLGTFFGLLRTNFVFYDPSSTKVLGEFNRKMTLFDKYALDLTFDKDRLVDRRIALALGIMLDTGERR